MRVWVAPIVLLFAFRAFSASPDVQTIIERSVIANNRDWKAAPEYSHFERDFDDGGSKTYQVFMIDGSPYQRLVAVNGKPLPESDQKSEQEKLNQTITRRQSESQAERAQRIEKYEKERKRDHLLMAQLTKALTFKLIGKQKLGSYNVYVLQATPRPGYEPPNRETEVLTGMKGRLWIDQKTFQWVKVQAEVIHPVSIEGFLARVEPGTRFELKKIPVADGVWLPSHFTMKARAKILFFFTYKSQDDETYFNYRKQPPLTIAGVK